MLSFYMTACRPLTARIEDRTNFSRLIFELPRDYNNNNNNHSARGSIGCVALYHCINGDFSFLWGDTTLTVLRQYNDGQS